VLQRSRIDTLVCQLEAAGMAQDVRMHAKCHLGGLTEQLSWVPTLGRTLLLPKIPQGCKSHSPLRLQNLAL